MHTLVETRVHHPTGRARPSPSATEAPRAAPMAEPTLRELGRCAAEGPSALGGRLHALEREWDMDRVVGLEAATTGLTALALGELVDRRWRLVPGIVSTALIVRALTGAYPQRPLLRRLGVREAREIVREWMALKALRGDFTGTPTDPLVEPGLATLRIGPRGTRPPAAPETPLMPATRQRVARSSSTECNRAVRAATDARVRSLAHAGPVAQQARLERLADEWDVERVLQMNAGLVSLTGWLLARRVDSRFLWLTAGVYAFFAQHAVQGWCPPLPVLRRLGVRTAAEIARERAALKALRGDFQAVPAVDASTADARARAALAAADL